MPVPPPAADAHEIKVSSAKALEYSDDAPLEHHHLASAFKVLHRHNFLRPGMSREDYRTFRALTIEVNAAPQPVHRRRARPRLNTLPPPLRWCSRRIYRSTLTSYLSSK